jgi:hypothetical protein
MDKSFITAKARANVRTRQRGGVAMQMALVQALAVVKVEAQEGA